MMDDSPTIVNVVGTGDLNASINLEHLYTVAENDITTVRYDPEHHQGCYLRFGEDGSLITIYNSGKYIIRSESLKKIHKERHKLLKYFLQAGITKSIDQVCFDINNIVGVASLNREIALGPLSEDLTNGNANYIEPDGRLEYHLNDNTCTVNIYRTGKIVLMGANSSKKFEQAWENLSQEINLLFEDKSI